jgi:hypothetical protein
MFILRRGIRIEKNHCPTLSGASFASAQKFERTPFFNGCSYGIQIMESRHEFPTEFLKNLPIGSEVDGGQTHRQELAYIFALGRKVG